MRFEIVLFFIVTGLLFHIYTDGKYLKMIVVYKKYAQMAGVLVGAFLLGSNEYLKYLPVDKNATSMLSPILDFTAKRNFSQGTEETGYNFPVLQVPNAQQRSEHTILQSGKKNSKRSVSETKKKFVASRQNWRCGGCEEQLNAWFEVDHKIRLADGGSNHVDNLIAYCRECHGQKTTIENL